MRLRLGLLQNPEAIERQLAREAQEAAAKKAKADIPTVKTEAQAKADEATKAKDKEKGEKSKHQSPRIRPLSEAKAIDSGANFISETFLFSVGLGLIVFETWRSRRKEQNRRNDVADKLAELEARDQEKDRLLRELEQELAEVRAKEGSSRSRWALSGSQLFSTVQPPSPSQAEGRHRTGETASASNAPTGASTTTSAKSA